VMSDGVLLDRGGGDSFCSVCFVATFCWFCSVLGDHQIAGVGMVCVQFTQPFGDLQCL
jgi:hypothetical protein